MAILTMVVFWLPPETPSKLILGMNVFGAFFFLLLILADFVPTASNKIPMIGKNFILIMFKNTSFVFKVFIIVPI